MCLDTVHSLFELFPYSNTTRWQQKGHEKNSVLTECSVGAMINGYEQVIMYQDLLYQTLNSKCVSSEQDFVKQRMSIQVLVQKNYTKPQWNLHYYILITASCTIRNVQKIQINLMAQNVGWWWSPTMPTYRRLEVVSPKEVGVAVETELQTVKI